MITYRARKTLKTYQRFAQDNNIIKKILFNKK